MTPPISNERRGRHMSQRLASLAAIWLCVAMVSPAVAMADPEAQADSGDRPIAGTPRHQKTLATP